MFGFGGVQRSQAYGCLWGDLVPNSLTAAELPHFPHRFVVFQNDPDSTGNLQIGTIRLATVGNGFTLAPGETTGIIPINDFGLFWHKESDATTYLRYYAILHCGESGALFLYDTHPHILQENSFNLLAEDDEHLIQES